MFVGKLWWQFKVQTNIVRLDIKRLLENGGHDLNKEQIDIVKGYIKDVFLVNCVDDLNKVKANIVAVDVQCL